MQKTRLAIFSVILIDFFIFLLIDRPKYYVLVIVKPNKCKKTLVKIKKWILKLNAFWAFNSCIHHYFSWNAKSIPKLHIPSIKHEYLRSRASTCVSLSSSASSYLLEIYRLSRYSCFYLGSLHPRILFLYFYTNDIQGPSQNAKIVTDMHSVSKKKKYSDMLNMKALVGIRIVFMGKEFDDVLLCINTYSQNSWMQRSKIKARVSR